MKPEIQFIQTKESKLESIDFSDIPFGKVFTDHMFEVDFKDGKWQNPTIKPFQNLNMHPATMALHYGQAIFEGMKASIDYDGNPLLFRPIEHAKRLNQSARRMCMPELPEELFLEAVNQLTWLERNWIPKEEGSALYLRPFMFATDEFVGVRPSERYKFIILALPVGPYYNKPVKLLAEHKYVRAVKGGIGEAKAAGNYGASMLPSKEAKDKGYDQVLWLDAHEFKYIQEVGTMNIFFVINGEILTPAAEGAILKGITRASIIKLLRDEGYTVTERPITIDEIKNAYSKGELDEVFGSGTAAVIAHVSEVADKDYRMTFEASDWVISKKIKKMINGLRNRTVEDKNGWVVPVEAKVTA